MRYVVGTLLLGALALGAWFALRTDPALPVGRRVLVITIDTTRADAVGRGTETPAIAAFLDEATHFAATRVSVPQTLPSHVSLFTGLAPARHGVHENLVPPLPAKRPFALLAEEFQRAGYATAGFVSSPVLGEKTGLGAGFETYVSPRFSGGRWSGNQSDVPAKQRAAEAISWLRKHRTDRFFCWVHFFDPHAPYLPYEGDARRRATEAGMPRDALYAGEVRRVDAQIERLLATVPADTIIVVATDHGEGLGAHGEPTHGVLCYATTVAAFLAVRAPALTAGAVDHGPRSLNDVAPTLRGWCGLAAQPTDGLALTDDASGRVVVSESLVTFRTYGWGQVFAATDGRFSLVETGPRVELFDIAADPREERPLDPVGHAAYEPLDRALTAYRAGAARPEPAGAYFDAGSPYGHAVRPVTNYLSRPDNAALPDPGHGFEFRSLMKTARGYIHLGRIQKNAQVLRQAIGILEDLARREPGNPAPLLYLAHARGRLGYVSGDKQLHRDAAAAARAAIERGYRVAPLLYDLLYESLHGGHLGDLRAALLVARDGRITP
ncbi:MAG: sulfatase, partial [Planctomycetota bacterium]|nr:sulfatase [Planctomycetota bacterium]